MPASAYLAGPMVAILTIAVLAVVLHRGLQRDAETPAPVAPVPDDYGLLASAAVARTLPDAALIRDHLHSVGIRATLATAPDGRIRVLVFADEVHRARRVVGETR
ncbi:hypothetical protein CS0771_21760 [Catellatospora sp. IY07-71]|uniref:hypothetical protein n=1 Tax=Catellatospora sp. IY07-71 TaxID=2728827 RepID=UPI001BB4045B|nr:hypothetical protein [Catellatospora sp. IY07-71]BCJ72632.1 hypothetical protein CS0771_21760 [Catellatospora sp. IY07-71]